MCFSTCGHRVLHNADMHFYTATKYALTEDLQQVLWEAKTHIRDTCLQADDIANAVLHVLSAPHVQIGDIQMRPVEQLT
ncbi:dehydrogenase/reductase SDR family member 11-like isoform X3 [Myxocyprinus asiaticus]|uniref:dehydrogenase/reductase SDR family member 11-like isoform X3 n=1 Tax=Myxocyprinus asiaticus TaxID=70543 RepID=UPI002222F0BC|nr:dehydrogenase/reductase SDR family member 11-like isoform X3 [Myxocyprinus asiaticus]